MIFSKEFTPLEKIQLLQRSILVNSYVYYELNNNLLSDYQYDMNAKQLADLKKQYPEEYKRSSYYSYFRDFCSENDNEHYTSGFDLLQQVEEKDPRLYRRIWIDSMLALQLKDENLV
jgi:NAD-dependent DNA ligase